MSSWSSLPKELLISVFAYITNTETQRRNNKTIYNCQFVCKAWSSSATTALYRKVFINANARQFNDRLYSSFQPGRFVKCISFTSDFEAYDQNEMIDLFSSIIKKCQSVEKLYISRELKSTIWEIMISENIVLDRLKDITGFDWDDVIDFDDFNLYEKVVYKSRNTLTRMYYTNLQHMVNGEPVDNLKEYVSLETLCICRGIYFSVKLISDMINSSRTLKNLELGHFLVYGDEDHEKLQPNTTVRRIQSFSDILFTKSSIDFFNSFKALQELIIHRGNFTTDVDEESWRSLISLSMTVPKCSMSLNIELNNHIYLEICAEEASKMKREKKRLFLLLDEDCMENLFISSDERTFNLTLEVGDFNDTEALLASMSAYNPTEIAVAHQKAAVEFVHLKYESNFTDFQRQWSWLILDGIVGNIDRGENRTKTAKFTEMVFLTKPDNSNLRTDKLDDLIFSASIFRSDMLTWISHRFLTLKSLTIQACHFLPCKNQKNTLKLSFAKTSVKHLILYLRRSLTNFYISYKTFEKYPTFDFQEYEENTSTDNHRFDELPLMRALAQEKYRLTIKTNTKTYDSYRDRNGQIDSEIGSLPEHTYTIDIVCVDLERLTILNGVEKCVLDITKEEL
ncbi:hypothetical protein BDF20DRAFT_860348 [Mycotypha africana]|uniref:uncharacterized protein n=1 Tax=Mycotypha africana TaxID=64632 RepID=UPI0023014CFD|nr:uncharacterized protein BDF20DRAFT_860348 [Mycotypha africana]KAI8984511.1 hypothetical protein BDF20DRAFT_860348 [Mycotypha africana]